MRIAILGAGAWGTALALSLSERHAVLLWGRDPMAMAAMARQRVNARYLPGYPLPPALHASADLGAALDHVQPQAGGGLVIVATPVAGLRPLCGDLQQLRAAGRALPGLVSLCKGFEQGSSLLPHQVIGAVLGPAVDCGVLSGPSFAQEVAAGLPCALTIASGSRALCEQVVAAAHSRTVRIYSTDDVAGVEIGGAVKNIMAIATGVIDGMGFGANARAALITRGLAEMTRLGLALGGRAETFMGLTGLGDLLLTCTGDLSRNRQVGLGLAQGKSLAVLVAELGHVAEGVHCARVVRALAQTHQVDMPISAAVADLLFDGGTAQAMVTRLLARDPRTEIW